VADIGTINMAISAAKQEQNELILPAWNTNNFSRNGTYVHNFGSEEAFWMYGNFTENVLAKKFLDVIPLDPRTSQYYSYWVTKESYEFEVAWVVKDKEIFKAKVSWDYKVLNGIYSLIRQYNWPNYVIDNEANLPYNPENRILVATDKNWKIYHEWEIITNTTWNDLEIFFSDGSASVISAWTTLELTELTFPKENNLLTSIRVFLQAGAIWTQATQLWEGAKFEINTMDITASVRWTVFWVLKWEGSSSTQVVVIEWIVDVINNETGKSIEVKWGEIAEGTETNVELMSRDDNVTTPEFSIPNI
jgi:hypothetical protein